MTNLYLENDDIIFVDMKILRNVKTQDFASVMAQFSEKNKEIVYVDDMDDFFSVRNLIKSLNNYDAKTVRTIASNFGINVTDDHVNAMGLLRDLRTKIDSILTADTKEYEFSRVKPSDVNPFFVMKSVIKYEAVSFPMTTFRGIWTRARDGWLSKELPYTDANAISFNGRSYKVEIQREHVLIKSVYNSDKPIKIKRVDLELFAKEQGYPFGKGEKFTK